MEHRVSHHFVEATKTSGCSVLYEEGSDRVDLELYLRGNWRQLGSVSIQDLDELIQTIQRVRGALSDIYRVE